ncbi:hypothetical protein F383_14010 [Gossypium arboreum]|uniref:Uncharacterized protein n=1 Tax=Gossypium arboreum TaxID=29729 RepID=A0A0B0NEH7_GOSAR|nr:hypothetical protein F383_14010 [Gossypium arboreum]
MRANDSQKIKTLNLFIDLSGYCVHSVSYLNPEWMANYICVTQTL